MRFIFYIFPFYNNENSKLYKAIIEDFTKTRSRELKLTSKGVQK